MAPLCLSLVSALLLCPAAAAALQFTPVYECNRLAFANFNSSSSAYEPRHIAVYKDKIFLGLNQQREANGTTVLASLPTAASTPPTLQPFRSWQTQISNCSSVIDVRDLEVDSVGRLWTLDDGGESCPPKLWIFDLNKNRSVTLEYDLVIVTNPSDKKLQDMAQHDSFAYIVPRSGSDHLVVFDLENKSTWKVQIGGQKEIRAIAFAPTSDSLYLGSSGSSQLFSASAHDARCGTKLTLEPVEASTASAWYSRMTIDRNGVLYFKFNDKNSVYSWNTSKSWFSMELVYQDRRLQKEWPFTFTSDLEGNFWILAQCDEEKYKLVKGTPNTRKDSSTTRSDEPTTRKGPLYVEFEGKSSNSASRTPEENDAGESGAKESLIAKICLFVGSVTSVLGYIGWRKIRKRNEGQYFVPQMRIKREDDEPEYCTIPESGIYPATYPPDLCERPKPYSRPDAEDDIRRLKPYF